MSDRGRGILTGALRRCGLVRPFWTLFIPTDGEQWLSGSYEMVLNVDGAMDIDNTIGDWYLMDGTAADRIYIHSVISSAW